MPRLRYCDNEKTTEKIMKNPKVSIIVPVFNGEKYLEKSIESAINQTCTDIEIIVINDGSADNSSVLLEKFAEKDRRVKLIHQETLGPGGARNTGLKIATGDCIFFLDSDDYIADNTIEYMYNTLVEKEADIVCCGAYSVNKNHKRPRPFIEAVDMTETGPEALHRFFVFETYGVSIWNKLYKRELITKSGISFAEGRYFEDTLFMPILLYSAEKIVSIEKYFYYYVRRVSSITLSYSKKHADDMIFSIEELNRFLKDKKITEDYKISYRRFYLDHVLMIQSYAVFAGDKEGVKKAREMAAEKGFDKNELPMVLRIKVFLLQFPFLYKIIFRIRLFISIC